MGRCAPWNDKQKEMIHKHEKTLICNKKHTQGMDPMGLGDPWCPFIQQLLKQLKT